MKTHSLKIIFTITLATLWLVICPASAQSVGSASSVSPIPVDQAPSWWVLPVINVPFVVSTPSTGMSLALDNQLLLGWFPWTWTTPYTPPTRPFMSLGIPANYDTSVGSAGNR